MDEQRLMRLKVALTSIPTRRHVLHGLAALGLASGGSCLPEDALARKKKKKKGKGKKKKKQPTPPPVPPTSPPPPPGCTPTCEGKPCGADDGCGGICGCPAGSVCDAGVCQACTITCDGGGKACGDALQMAIAAGGTIYACPGRYVGNFEATAANLTLVGAGNGDDPASSTILDANGSGRVMHVKPGATATLRSLRFTGGNLTGDNDVGAGVFNQGRLTLAGCTVHKSTAKNGGGIAQFSTAELTLSGCTISENTTDGYGGGIYGNTGPITIDNSAITGNKGLFGGAIANLGSAVTIRGSTVTGNRAKLGAGFFTEATTTFDSASRVSANIANEDAGGIYQAHGATTTLNGARIVSNVPDNCVAASGPPPCSNA